jgi:hypothetical protein
MTATRTSIIPGLPLRARNLLWQRFGAEPHEVELWQVNVGQVDPTLTVGTYIDSGTTITTHVPQILGSVHQGQDDLSWEWPKVARAEGAFLTLCALSWATWGPNVAGATRTDVIGGVPSEMGLDDEVIVPQDVQQYQYQSTWWSRRDPTPGALLGLRGYGVRYAELAPFAVSCADAMIAASLGPDPARETEATVDLSIDGGLPALQEVEIAVSYSDQDLRVLSTAHVIVMAIDYRRLELNAYGGL